MTERDDRLYLIHIQECPVRIEQYTTGGESVFLADTKTQDAVLRNLHTLAESTQRISEAWKARPPDVNWRGIAALRKVVVQDYLAIDLKQIWDIVKYDIPGLKCAVESMLAEPG